jgi:glutaredoxin
MTNAIVWTLPNDKKSKIAVNSLKRQGITVEERPIGKTWTKAALAAAIPGATKVPQIVIDNAVVGGIKQLMAHPTYGPKATPPMPAALKPADIAAARTAAKAARAAARVAAAPAPKTADAIKAAAATKAAATKTQVQTHVAARVAAVKAAHAK